MATMTAQRQKILVVDDDLRLRDLLKRYLGEQGFAVDTVPDTAAMDRQMQRVRYDLMVLDLMLPREDGLAACRRLRAANDYLAKPFNPRELVARIHAVLRRQGARVTPGAPTEEPAQVAFGPYALDLSTRQLTRAGEPIALTTGEFSLLKALALHPRQPMSRDKLMELARGRELESTDRSIDVQVSRLRKLLAEDPQNPRYIQTVWGFGYVFVPDGVVAR
jgi:two-component system, OmpR family, phosphate regulon response regulator OmpR